MVRYSGGMKNLKYWQTELSYDTGKHFSPNFGQLFVFKSLISTVARLADRCSTAGCGSPGCTLSGAWGVGRQLYDVLRQPAGVRSPRGWRAVATRGWWWWWASGQWGRWGGWGGDGAWDAVLLALGAGAIVPAGWAGGQHPVPGLPARELRLPGGGTGRAAGLVDTVIC